MSFCDGGIETTAAKGLVTFCRFRYLQGGVRVGFGQRPNEGTDDSCRRCRCGLFRFEGVDHFFDVFEAVVVAVVFVEDAVLS